MFYCRLARTPNTLPLHWAYKDAWDYDPKTGWKDNRVSGFQVFDNCAHAIAGLMAVDADGSSYPIAEYPQLLLIETESDLADSCSCYSAMDCEDVVSVRAVSSEKVANEIEKIYKQEAEKYGYQNIYEWAEDSEEEILEILIELSEPVSVSFVETLPQPVLMEVA